MGFDRRGTFSVTVVFGRNLIIFGIDMSSFVHVDNKGKDILILGGRSDARIRQYHINCRKNDQFH